MENKQMDSQLELRIKEIMVEKVPESEIVDKKMKDAYKEIRETKTAGKRKVPITVKFSAAAAVLMLAMIYCVKNPAFAAQLPLIGNIFRGLEGQISYPGDYSKNSITLPVTADAKEDDAKPGQADAKEGGAEPNQTDAKEDDAKPNQAESGGITVTLSEVSYDHNAIYLAILVQNEEGFAKDALYSDLLCFDYRVKLYRADGSTEDFNYESIAYPTVGRYAEGEFVDRHTFKGILRFTEPGLDLSGYTACELVFMEFQQVLETGKTEIITVPDYGEVSRMVYDVAHYAGSWDFRLDFDGLAAGKAQEIAVNDANDQGFGIEKVVKTEYEIYAVPLLPEGEKEYDYMVTIWDADGKPLEMRDGDFRRGTYGRDLSEVTVYLLRWEDFERSKGNNSYLQPSKAIYQTTVSFEDWRDNS